MARGNMTDLAENVQNTISSHDMIQSGERVLAAVSGGPDSMALLHVLHGLKYTLEIAHLDHGTRGGESAEDAAFVRAAAQALGLPFHLESREIQREAKTAGRSFEEFAREARYAFLLEVAQESGIPVLAVGHHADDQAETVLMRMLRGASPRGIAGIPPKREQNGVRIVRPLLDCARAEILAYLQRNNIAYRTDASNHDPHYLRNRVRHELLPQLRSEYNPRIEQALVRLADTQRGENDLLETLTDAFLARIVTPEGYLDRTAFTQGDTALQRRALLALAWQRGVVCPFDIVEAARNAVLRAPAGHTVDLGAGVTLRVSRCVAEFFDGQSGAPTQHSVMAPGETIAFEKRLAIRYLTALPAEDLTQYCTPRRQVFDADALGMNLVVRRRRAGDRFTPYGMKGTRKLKDYLSDLGMPMTERNTQLLLIAGDRIAWVVGHAVSAHVAVTAATRRFVEIEVTDATV